MPGKYDLLRAGEEERRRTRDILSRQMSYADKERLKTDEDIRKGRFQEESDIRKQKATNELEIEKQRALIPVAFERQQKLDALMAKLYRDTEMEKQKLADIGDIEQEGLRQRGGLEKERYSQEAQNWRRITEDEAALERAKYNKQVAEAKWNTDTTTGMPMLLPAMAGKPVEDMEGIATPGVRKKNELPFGLGNLKYEYSKMYGALTKMEPEQQEEYLAALSEHKPDIMFQFAKDYYSVVPKDDAGMETWPKLTQAIGKYSGRMTEGVGARGGTTTQPDYAGMNPFAGHGSDAYILSKPIPAPVIQTTRPSILPSTEPEYTPESNVSIRRGMPPARTNSIGPRRKQRTLTVGSPASEPFPEYQSNQLLQMPVEPSGLFAEANLSGKVYGDTTWPYRDSQKTRKYDPAKYGRTIAAARD